MDVVDSGVDVGTEVGDAGDLVVVDARMRRRNGMYTLD